MFGKAVLASVALGVGTHYATQTPTLDTPVQREALIRPGSIDPQVIAYLDHVLAAKRHPKAPSILHRIARAESGGNPHARNARSTASGAFQFTNGTWSLVVKKWGKPLGIRLRDKNKASAQLAMMEKLAEDNARIMAGKLGRKPTDGELYAAHVFGARDVVKLIEARDFSPNRRATSLYPRSLVTANRSIFYDGKRPRTVGQLCRLLEDRVA